MLQYARSFAERLVEGKLYWSSIKLKADMNPFRTLTYNQSLENKNKWAAMLQRCNIFDFLIVEADMLMYDYDV